MATVFKDGQPYNSPGYYGDRWMDPSIFDGVVRVLAQPAVEDIGSLEYNILKSMIKAGLAPDEDVARWHFHHVAGYLQENGLLKINLRPIFTAGGMRFFYRLATEVTVQLDETQAVAS